MALSGGGQFTRRAHLLSRDGRLLLVCAANSIRVYSAATAEQLFTMHGHTEEVTCLCLHPKNQSEVYSSSLDGTVALWDLQSGTRLQSWSVINEAIESLAVVGSTAILTCYWREAKAGRALALDLTKDAVKDARYKLAKPRALACAADSSVVATFDRHKVFVWDAPNFGSAPALALHHTKAFTCVAVSPDGSRVAAGDVSGRILVWHNIAPALAARAQDRRRPPLPQQVAAGEEEREKEGQKVVDVSEPPAATVHWHAHAVGCLAFSQDGAFLLSGGQEAVLVLWDAASGKRGYLPRLGGPLVGIATCSGDAARYAIRQADNTVRVINAAAMTVDASLHGLRPLPRRHAAEQAALLTMQPGSGLAVVAGPHAVLQWYDLCRDAHIDKLQLSQRNIVTLTEADSRAMGGVYGPTPEPSATEIAFSRDGSAMATVESRPDPAGGGGLHHCLRFWDKAAPGEARYGSPYRINTIADIPHRSSAGLGSITALAFHPFLDVAVTTSDIGEFKLWTRPIPTKQQQQRQKSSSSSSKDHEKRIQEAAKTAWRCAAVGTHRDEPLTAAAFSPDGSVLALGSSSGGVTLWDAHQTAMLGVLPPAWAPAADGQQQQVRRLLFLPKSPLLVACFSCGLAVYNLLTMRCEWAAETGSAVGALAVDPASRHWAAVLSEPKHAQQQQQPQQTQQQHGVFLFEGATRTPVCQWKLRRVKIVEGVAVAFAPPGTPLHAAAAAMAHPGSSPLVVVTPDREYAVAAAQQVTGVKGEAAAAAVQQQQVGAGKAGAGAAPGAFEAMFGRSARVDMAAKDAAATGVSSEGGGSIVPAWGSLFDAPSHALPPMSTLLPAFLELMVAPQAGKSGGEE